jgi:hypothetical protein
MRKAALSSIAFLAGLLLLLGLASAYYEWRVRSQDPFFQQVTWFDNPAVQPTVLFLGDSRVAMNIAAERLPGGFVNWSYPGETLRHVMLRAHHAIDTKPTLKYIVLGLDDITLSEPRAADRDATRQLQFADLREVAVVYPWSPRLLLRSAVLYYFPLVNETNRHRMVRALESDIGAFFGVAPPREPTRLECGDFEFSRRVTWSDRLRPDGMKRSVEHIRSLLGESNDTEELRVILVRLLRLAESRGVRVIGLRNPLSDAYQEIAAAYDTSSAINFMAAQPLHAYLDLHDAFAGRDDLFADQDHLGPAGARQFTDMVVQILRGRMGIRGTGPAPCEVQEAARRPVWPYHSIAPDHPIEPPPGTFAATLRQAFRR